MMDTNIEGITLTDLLKHAVALRLKQPISFTGATFKITIDDYHSIIINIVNKQDNLALPIDDEIKDKRFNAYAYLSVGNVIIRTNKIELGNW